MRKMLNETEFGRIKQLATLRVPIKYIAQELGRSSGTVSKASKMDNYQTYRNQRRKKRKPNKLKGFVPWPEVDAPTPLQVMTRILKNQEDIKMMLSEHIRNH